MIMAAVPDWKLAMICAKPSLIAPGGAYGYVEM